MKYFHSLRQRVDVEPLRLALARQPWLWDQQPLRREMPDTPHGGMKDIWVRYNAYKNFTGDVAKFNAEHDSVWYPAWYALPELQPIVFGLMSLVRGERLGGILITTIPPGGEIASHVDDGWHVRYYDKYYVQVDSGPGALFWAEDTSFVPEVGEVYFFDNKVTHGVRNLGSATRTTLIICIKSDRYGQSE